MSAISLILLATAGTAVSLGVAALYTARQLRAEVSALRDALTRTALPAARPVPHQEIRAAVSEALAAERERELAEARAYWAEQEARDGEGPGRLLAGGGLDHEVAAEADEDLLDALLERFLLSDSGYAKPSRDAAPFLPRQAGPEAAEPVDGPPTPDGAGAQADAQADTDADTDAEADAPVGVEAVEAIKAVDAIDAVDAPPDIADDGDTDWEGPGERAAEAAEAADEDSQDMAEELAAARRRHPSHPGYTLTGEPVDEHRRTTARLAQLAEARTPLADVRQGPLGTLDIYLFTDGTTLCLSPSHQQAAERLAAAVREGRSPVLMGGSGVSGAYALTFSCGQENVFLLADRVVATSRQR